MVLATFRQNFPEFDETKYPDPMVTFWSTLGEKLISCERFGDVRPQAVELYTAHHLVIAKSNANLSANGALPGQTIGPTSSKTVGSVSVSYDTQATLETNGGYWNTTTYGKQLFYLMRIFGAGAVQL